MPAHYKKKVSQADIPEDFSKETLETVNRIDGNPNVIGVVYLKDNAMKMCTVPESLSGGLISKLPMLTKHMSQALGEINVLDELVAYRIETKTTEIVVAPALNCTMCVVLKVHKKQKHKKP